MWFGLPINSDLLRNTKHKTMKLYQMYFSLIFTCFIMQSITLQAQGIIDFEFVDTFSYTNGSFISSETVFTDISDNGTAVGYYLNEMGTYSGLAYTKDGVVISFNHPDFANTQITGVNNNNKVLGKAFDSSVAGAIFYGILGDSFIGPIENLEWNDPNGQNKESAKLNNNDVAMGTVRIGTNRWLHIEEIDPVVLIGNERFSISNPTFTTYNTFGLGLNDNGRHTAYYIDGNERKPLIYDEISGLFQVQNHVAPGAGIPTTYLNDINNNNNLAVSYRDATGVWRGTIGNFDGINVTYDNTFTLAQFYQSSVNGINNNDDIVGEFFRNGKTIAYVAYTDPLEYEDFDISTDSWTITNNFNIFKYLPGDFNYQTTDPYLATPDSFYSNYIVSKVELPESKRIGILEGTINPSWRAFVDVQDEELSYITQSDGTKIPKASAVNKWIHNVDNTFKGYCYGMSIFALEHYRGIANLQARFPNRIPDQTNLIDYQASNLPFNEVFATLQLHQFGLHLDGFYQEFQAQKSLFANNSKTALYGKMGEVVREITRDFWSVDVTDNLHVVSSLMNVNSTFFAHALVPVKIGRFLSVDYAVDTVYCLDPNRFQSLIKVVIDYEMETAYATTLGGTGLYGINTFVDYGTVEQINAGAHAVLREDNNWNEDKHSSNNTTALYPKLLSAYTITNANDVSQTMSLNGLGEYESSWTDMIPQYTMDEDDIPDRMVADGLQAVQVNMTGSDSTHNWLYSYPDGEMMYSRSNAQSGETDVVLNDGAVQTVSNPDNVAKDVTITSMFGTGNEETLVSISDVALSQNESIKMNALNELSLLLSNENVADNNYDVNVSFINENQSFEWQASNIDIDGATDHLILIQPDDEQNQVVILVDEGQDGTIEDTLFHILSTTIYDVLSVASVTTYPNPTSDVLHISVISIQSGSYKIRLYNTVGDFVSEKPLNTSMNTSTEIRVSHLPSGLYFLEVVGPSGELVATKKVLIN